jgi:hypothetical protein
MKALAIIETTDNGTMVTFDEVNVFDLSGVNHITHELIKEMLFQVKLPVNSAEELKQIWDNQSQKG